MQLYLLIFQHNFLTLCNTRISYLYWDVIVNLSRIEMGPPYKLNNNDNNICFDLTDSKKMC